MANRKLLFIAYYLPPMGSSGVQRPYHLLKMLPKLGWDPIVLCPETGLYHTLDHSLGQRFDELKLPVYRVKSKTPFHLLGGQARVMKPSPEKVSKILRWISSFFFLPDNKKAWIKPAIVQGRAIIRKYKSDLIVATSPPPSNLIIASELATEFKLPVVFDMRDDWLENHQQIYPSGIHKAVMAKIERNTIPKANAIISVNPVIQRNIQSRYPESKAFHASIPSGFDADVFTNNLQPSLKQEEGKYTFLYSGRFYGENQPDLFAKAMASLIQKKPELRSRIKLAFQGGLEPRHIELFRSLNLSELIEDLGYVDHQLAVANLLQADALWVIAAHSNKADQVSTGKVTEYFGSNKPVFAIAPTGGALHQLVSEYGPSYQADPKSRDSVLNTLNVLIDDLVNGTLKPVNKEYVKKFTIQEMASSMMKIFNKAALSSPD